MSCQMTVYTILFTPSTFGAQDSKVEAEAVNQRQTIFLSILAHELRNPMAAIAVANTVLESLNLTHPRVAKLLAIVRRQIGHLVRLVDDLLDASRIMTGKIAVQTYLIRLSDVIDSAMETVQPLLTERNQTFQVDLPPSIALIGDHVRLSQLFSNLLINACKFSAPSTVVMISASVLGDELEVIIRDSGKGVALEHQTDIFALFSQGSEPMGGSLGGGLGIGLTLVRTIAEMHGGSVRVDSKGVGCGSAFIVTLPLPAKVAIREKVQSNNA